MTWVQNQPELHWEKYLEMKSKHSEEKPFMEVEENNAVSYNSVDDGDKEKNGISHNGVPNVEKQSSFAKLSSDAVFLCYCAAVFFLSFVRDGLLAWIFSFLEFRRGTSLSIDMTSMLGAGITVGGFLGGISCGVLSDLVFKGSRIQPILVFTTGKSRDSNGCCFALL